jgi:hypothetical protein
MRKIIFAIIAVGVVGSCYLSFLLAGVFGLLVWFCIFMLIGVEIVYFYGVKGPRIRGWRSNVGSDVPDSKTEANMQLARGWYDLDYRGRGKN